MLKNILLLFVALLLFSNISFAKSVNISMDNWQHPTKEIFEQYGFQVAAVELYSDETYPVFLLQPYNHKVSIYDYRFLSKIAEKNGFWNCKIISGDHFVEVVCDKMTQRVIMTKSDIENKEYDDYDLETAKQKAIELVMRDRKLTYNEATDEYSREGKSFTVKLKAFGFDANGRYEIRISPSYYTLSVFSYCYVDLRNETVLIKGAF